jgi:hypothetical protein
MLIVKVIVTAKASGIEVRFKLGNPFSSKCFVVGD